MTAQDLVFLLLAIASGLSAVAVVTSKNLVHAALFLAMTLGSIAGVFFTLHADFVGLVQLVVYVGAVAVLFLFGLMLTRAPIGRDALDGQQRGLALGVSLAMFGVLATLMIEAFGEFQSNAPAGPDVGELGESIFSRWVLPFELSSMLLLAALVGAVLLSRREDGETGEAEPQVEIQLASRPSSQSSDAASEPIEIGS